MNKTEIIRCACNSNEHILIIDEDLEDKYPMAYVQVYLSKKPLIKKIKYAFKYIFGYQSKYGAFEEIILDKDNTKQLYEMLKKWNDE